VPRIVTLLAAATEIVAAVGAGEELVGVSHECDHPPEAVAGRPVLTTARVGPLPSSASVDRSVRQLVADALAVYDIDTELLAALAPDVIVTQDLCRVCAVNLDDVRAVVARLAANDSRWSSSLLVLSARWSSISFKDARRGARRRYNKDRERALPSPAGSCNPSMGGAAGNRWRCSSLLALQRSSNAGASARQLAMGRPLGSGSRTCTQTWSALGRPRRPPRPPVGRCPPPACSSGPSPSRSHALV
jgi:hypothetical protein